MIRFILIVLLCLGLIAIPNYTANAQSVTCSTYNWPNTDQGWTIDDGTVNGQSVVSENGVAPVVVGNLGKKIKVTLTLAAAKRFRWIEFITYSTSTQTATIKFDTFLSGVFTGEHYQFPSNQPSTWLNGRVNFQGQAANSAVIEFTVETPTNLLQLRIKNVCVEFAVTMTPTSSDTPTVTPSYTQTPTPSNTYTPGGPTDTPGPLTTPTSTATIPPLLQNKDVFATIPPAKQCADVGSPCGVLPFPLPEFTAIAFNSPAPVTAAALNATSTLLPPPRTITPGGPTLTPNNGESGIAAYATNLASAANDLIKTPTVLDSQNQQMTMRDQANQIGTFAGSFLGIARAIQSLFLGKTGTVLFFLILILGFIVLVRLVLFVIPIIMSFVRMIFAAFAALNPF